MQTIIQLRWMLVGARFFFKRCQSAAELRGNRLKGIQHYFSQNWTKQENFFGRVFYIIQKYGGCNIKCQRGTKQILKIIHGK